MKDAIENAIHLLRDALQSAATDTTKARASVQQAINVLSPIVAAGGVGPDDEVGTRKKTG